MTEGTTPAPMQPPPSVPDFGKMQVPDVQILLQNLAQTQRDLSDERRNSAKRVAEERDRSRWETEKLREELTGKIRGLESEVTALVRTVGRLQNENDRLREENVLLKHTTSNGHKAEERLSEAAASTPPVAPTVSPSFGAPQLQKVQLVLPADPMTRGPARVSGP